MTEKIKKIYKSGLKNDKFLQVIKEADGDKKPNLFSSDLEKHIFSSVYYGWLVGKHGIAWELHI
jgi:hypothetical protein